MATSTVWPTYWSEIDWRVLTGFFVFVGAIISPVLAAWWKNKGGIIESKARAVEAAQAREDRLATERYATIERERDRALARQHECEAEIQRLQADRDEGWDLARAMDDYAHSARHLHVNCVMAHNALRDYLRRFRQGLLTVEIVDMTLDSIHERPEPDPIPALRALKRKPPS